MAELAESVQAVELTPEEFEDFPNGYAKRSRRQRDREGRPANGFWSVPARAGRGSLCAGCWRRSGALPNSAARQ